MRRIGRRTILYEKKVHIIEGACMAGKKESEGPLKDSFDEIIKDDLLGQTTWEKAESEMLRRCIVKCAEKAGKGPNDIEALLAGDLNAQIISAGFAARELGVPFFGMYGACSTMTEGLLTGAALIAGGALDNCVCAASSHFCTAERQFRTPLELGTQRPPSAQWTATASGACMLGGEETSGPVVTMGTIARVIDLKVKDANHMGAAMAPAVCDTLCGHLDDTRRSLKDYDMIVTGDLGKYGLEILKELIQSRRSDASSLKIMDCGASIFSDSQDVHAGGSGCGCIASVLSGYVLSEIRKGVWKRVLVLGSGAMLSLTSSQQGESIPSVSYGVCIEGEKA